MRESRLKSEMEKIEIPPSLSDRSRLGITQAKQTRSKKSRRVKFVAKYVAGVAVSAAVLFGIMLVSNEGFATSVKGQFKDILNWKGAVTDTEYLEATSEIDIALSEEPIIDSYTVVLPIKVTFLKETDPPYSVIDVLALKNFIIMGENEKIDPATITFESADASKTKDYDLPEELYELQERSIEGATHRIFDAKIIISKTDWEKQSNLSLKIQSFQGFQKADRPVEILGNWEIPLK